MANNGPTIVNDFPEAYRDKEVGANDAAVDSLREDLAELGEAYDPTNKYDPKLVSARVGHARADLQVRKLDRVRQLLLSSSQEYLRVQRRFLEALKASWLHAPKLRALALADMYEADDQIKRAILWSRDISTGAWTLCKCGHFYLDHKATGGCVNCSPQPCNCGERGVHDLPLDQQP